MLKRHEDALMTRIDQVTHRGWAHIAWWEAYLWYGAERISKKVWRDLRDRFSEENDGELHICEDDAGFLLLHNNALTDISKKLGEGDSED